VATLEAVEAADVPTVEAATVDPTAEAAMHAATEAAAMAAAHGRAVTAAAAMEAPGARHVGGQHRDAKRGSRHDGQDSGLANHHTVSS
jgi:hypothetical protein